MKKESGAFKAIVTFPATIEIDPENLVSVSSMSKKFEELKN